MTKEDFRRIPELRKEISRALNLWENAKENATRTTVLLTGMPKGNSVSSQVENAVIKAEVYKEQYDNLCAELNDIYTRLAQSITRYLNEDEGKVLRKIYVNGKKIHEVATDMKVTERHVYRIKKTAIYKVCR